LLTHKAGLDDDVWKVFHVKPTSKWLTEGQEWRRCC